MQHSRSIAMTAVGVTAALLLSACSSGGAGGGGTSAPQVGISAHKVVTIGWDSVQSGPQAVYWNETKAATAYLKNVNEKGGINGYTFAFQDKDNALSSSQSAAVTRDLSTNSFAVASFGTAPVQGMLSVAGKLGVPNFGTANGLYYTPPPDKYSFGENPNYAALAKNDIAFLVKKLGLKKIAYLYQNDDVGTPASKIVNGYAKSLGAEIVAQVPVPSTTTDFSAFAGRLANSGADGVDFVGSPAELAGVQNAAVALGYNPKWIGLWSLQDPSYTKAVPAAYVANTYSDAWMTPLNSTGNSEVDTYKKVVGKYYPDIVDSSLSEQGWIIGAIIAEAVKTATAGGKALTKDGFLHALATRFTGQQVGLMNVKFDAKSHAAASTAAVFGLSATGIGKLAQDFQPLPSAG
ncbi:MAG: hypothetical protein EPN48_18040 [Microbacteriaceae bacterium]|nr:MAG: hypothetical protein EPN48_18040 [Microbacteriaceae bacterium]